MARPTAATPILPQGIAWRSISQTIALILLCTWTPLRLTYITMFRLQWDNLAQVGYWCSWVAQALIPLALVIGAKSYQRWLIMTLWVLFIGWWEAQLFFNIPPSWFELALTK